MAPAWGSNLRVLLVVLGTPVAVSCFDESVLEGKDCHDGEDCWRTQSCAKTQYQATQGTPGWCVPKGESCLAGDQPGCACEANSGTGMGDCSSGLEATDPMTPAECLCCPTCTPGVLLGGPLCKCCQCEGDDEPFLEDDGECGCPEPSTGSSGTDSTGTG